MKISSAFCSFKILLLWRIDCLVIKYAVAVFDHILLCLCHVDTAKSEIPRISSIEKCLASVQIRVLAVDNSRCLCRLIFVANDGYKHFHRKRVLLSSCHDTAQR
jgi:hypothetical protein